MFRRFQFSLYDLLWATAMVAVLISISIFFIRNPWARAAAVALIVVLVLSSPTWIGAMVRRSHFSDDLVEPVIPLTVLLPLGVVVGAALPFLMMWLLNYLMRAFHG